MSEPAKKERAPRGKQSPEAIVEEAGLVALLDHLGRLLAREYVDRLKRVTPEPDSEKRR